MVGKTDLHYLCYVQLEKSHSDYLLSSLRTRLSHTVIHEADVSMPSSHQWYLLKSHIMDFYLQTKSNGNSKYRKHNLKWVEEQLIYILTSSSPRTYKAIHKIRTYCYLVS